MKLEAEEWQEKHDGVNDKVKQLEQENMDKTHEIQALTRKNQVLEEQLEKTEAELVENKATANESTSLKTSNENYNKKIQTLEEEIEESNDNLKKTTELLRESDLKLEQANKKIESLEAEKDDSEKKLEELEAKYAKAKEELEAITLELDAL